MVFKAEFTLHGAPGTFSIFLPNTDEDQPKTKKVLTSKRGTLGTVPLRHMVNLAVVVYHDLRPFFEIFIGPVYYGQCHKNKKDLQSQNVLDVEEQNATSFMFES